MYRDKLEEALRLSIASVLEYRVDKYEVELIADHLIAYGIGDVTAEKHRADIAEEALSRVKETAINILHIRSYDVDILLNRAIKAGVKVDDLLCSPKCDRIEKYEQDLQQAKQAKEKKE